MRQHIALDFLFLGGQTARLHNSFLADFGVAACSGCVSSAPHLRAVALQLEQHHPLRQLRQRLDLPRE